MSCFNIFSTLHNEQAPHARQILAETAPLISSLSRIPCRAEVQHFKRHKEDDVANHER